MEKPTLSGRCRRQFRGDSVSGTVDDSIDDSEGIICLNSRGLARVQSPLVGLARSGNPRLCFPINGIPEESFLILPILANIKKDSSGIHGLIQLPGVTASVRPIGLPSRQPPATQTNDSSGIAPGEYYEGRCVDINLDTPTDKDGLTSRRTSGWSYRRHPWPQRCRHRRQGFQC